MRPIAECQNGNVPGSRRIVHPNCGENDTFLSPGTQLSVSLDLSI